MLTVQGPMRCSSASPSAQIQPLGTHHVTFSNQTFKAALVVMTLADLDAQHHRSPPLSTSSSSLRIPHCSIAAPAEQEQHS